MMPPVSRNLEPGCETITPFPSASDAKYLVVIVEVLFLPTKRNKGQKPVSFIKFHEEILIVFEAKCQSSKVLV